MKKKKKVQHVPKPVAVPTDTILNCDYNHARKLAYKGQQKQAQELYARLETAVSDNALRALVINDRAALAAVAGDSEQALEGFQAALALDEHCKPARQNLTLLEDSESPSHFQALSSEERGQGKTPAPIKIAIISFLFNWPSTGGGNVHTYENKAE
jgi:hypothetical protein